MCRKYCVKLVQVIMIKGKNKYFVFIISNLFTSFVLSHINVYPRFLKTVWRAPTFLMRQKNRNLHASWINCILMLMIISKPLISAFVKTNFSLNKWGQNSLLLRLTWKDCLALSPLHALNDFFLSEHKI